MLDSLAPYYEAGLGNRLCYEITFNDYNRVTKSTVSSPKVPDAKYEISNISLEYEIVTNTTLARSIKTDNQFTKSAVASPDAMYKITDISLEYEIVTQPTLAKHISDEYQNMVLLYDRILRHRQIIVNKSDTTWNWSFDTNCKSLKGILVLFEGEQPYARDTGKFYNPKIQKFCYCGGQA